MKDKQKDNKYDTQAKTRRTMIGGQALLEGVMMRGKSSIALAVRSPEGDIELSTERLKPRGKASGIPIVRGVVSFVSSLVIGMKSLLRSAEVSAPEEETPSKTSTVISVILGVVLAVGLFIAVPWFTGWAIGKYTNLNVGLVSVIEGCTRLVIFIAYLALVRLIPDIKRTFMYHGAEHRTINCYEKGLPLTVENVQACSTKHNRCGTTFLFFVVIFAIIVYSLINWFNKWVSGYAPVFGNPFFALLIRLLFLPLIAGLSFELLRGLAMLPDNKFTNAIRAPGLLLQKLTTAIPQDDMAEVAICAFNAVLALDENANMPTIDFYERDFAAERKALADRLPLDPQDADWIYCEILDKPRAELSSVSTVKIGLVKQANAYADRLLAGEPLDYILGNTDFCGVKINVDGRVLIPRFSTEILAQTACEYIADRDLEVLDLCTGSGCLAAVIAKTTPAHVLAADISADALAVAATNVAGLNVTLVQSDMFENVTGRFDLIVTNPPYIRSGDIPALAPQVTCQPAIALDGGDDGLAFYRIIADRAAAHLNPRGVIMAEVGYDQAESVKRLFGPIGKCGVIKDLDGIDRIVVCECGKNSRI